MLPAPPGPGQGLQSRWLIRLYMLSLVVMLSMVSMAVPPLQSPDEPDHVRRAYLLGQGQLWLETPEDQMSGGWLDRNLDAYLVPYHRLSVPEHRHERLTAEHEDGLGDMEWSGERTTYAILPGTGYYFPAVYLPQALGLRLGELTGQTIATSYRLSRLAALLASFALLLAAMRYTRLPPAAAALLALPMSVFQVVSASVDGVANGLVLLAVAMFLALWGRTSLPIEAHAADGVSTIGAGGAAAGKPGAAAGRRLPSGGGRAAPHRALEMMALCASIFVLVTCRYHLAALLVLPFALAWRWRSWAWCGAALLLTAATLAWMGWSIATTVDTRVDSGASASEIILYYLRDPLAYFWVVYRTLSSTVWLQFMYESFLGRLAALDVVYNAAQYHLMAALVTLAVVLSVDLRRWRCDWQPRAVLLVCGLLAVPLAFCAMLISWTPHPADMVQGIQGRYFMGPALVLAYVLPAVNGVQRPVWITVLAWMPAVFLAIFSALTIPDLMLQRFYLQ